jgi:hypothetical protein
MMNAFSISEFPADVTFAVHFALIEGHGNYRLALFLESPKYPEDATANRHLLWEGAASLRSPDVSANIRYRSARGFLRRGNAASLFTPTVSK